MTGMLFWILIGAVAAAIAALLCVALIRGRQRGLATGGYDLAVYRRQLREVERDLARGVIAPSDAERARTEISRRILTADAQMQNENDTAPAQPRGLSMVVACIAAALLVLGSLALYSGQGAPGYGDLPLTRRMAIAEQLRAARLPQGDAEQQVSAALARAMPPVSPDLTALLEQLRAKVAQNPGDLTGQRFLADYELRGGNPVAARIAQERVVALLGDAAQPGDVTHLIELMVFAAGDRVSPEAEKVIRGALIDDPGNGLARYYLGVMFAQTARPDRTFGIWEKLLTNGPPDAPWIPRIRAQIEEIAYRAGVHKFSLPPAQPALRGPDADDIEAAGQMDAAARQQMIRAMVAGLSDRLATEGGPPEEWARLISSLAVLGDEAQAIAVYNNALEVFAATPPALETIRQSARRAGLIP